MTAQEIINRLNDLRREYDDLPETFIDLVIDAREDEGLPPMTQEELEKATEECDAAANRAAEIEREMDDLKVDYMALTGRFPRVGYANQFY